MSVEANAGQYAVKVYSQTVEVFANNWCKHYLNDVFYSASKVSTYFGSSTLKVTGIFVKHISHISATDMHSASDCTFLQHVLLPTAVISNLTSGMSKNDSCGHNYLNRGLALEESLLV